jgi:hypothetical protein
MSVKCPNCGYSLMSQPSHCSACGEQLDPAIFTAEAIIDSADIEEGLTTGQRVAGPVLIANGILVLAENAMMVDGEGFSNPIGSLVDIALGLMLLAGRRDVLGFTKFRAIAGALVFGGVYLAQGDMVMMTLQVIFSAALIALLFGDAGKLRIMVAAVAALGLIGLEILGLQMINTGESPAIMMTALYDSEPLDTDVLESPSHPYRMTAPGMGWEIRSDESARLDNPLADVWLVEPSWDAHIMVIAEAADAGYAFDVESLADVVVENARMEAEEFSVERQRHLAGVSTLGKQIDANAVIDGMNMRFRYGLFANGRHGVQVICFAREQSFENVEQACDEVLGSFQFDQTRLLAQY